VREAIDRGVPLDEVKPGNRISQEVKRLIGSHAAAGTLGAAAAKKLAVSWAR